ncbi:MAG TPA: hypothetical protein PLW14_05105 [Chlorobiota bacterium]|nr:hypothetical protein [Chlorobiota bacterium]
MMREVFSIFNVLAYWIPVCLALLWLLLRRRRIVDITSFVWQLTWLVPILLNYYLVVFWIDVSLLLTGASTSILVLTVMFGIVLVPLLLTSVFIRIHRGRKSKQLSRDDEA